MLAAYLVHQLWLQLVQLSQHQLPAGDIKHSKAVHVLHSWNFCLFQEMELLSCRAGLTETLEEFSCSVAAWPGLQPDVVGVFFWN